MYKPLLPLPQLDDRTYEDLVEEARAAIPGFHPQWTDHNPTDPGIALIELLAWLTEMIIYRVNQLPDQNYQTFIKLLGGPNGKRDDHPDPDTAILETVLSIGERYRAVTREDYEYLVKHQWPKIPIKDAMQLLFKGEAAISEILESAQINPETAIEDLPADQLSGHKDTDLDVKEDIKQRFRFTAGDFIKDFHVKNLMIGRIQCVPQYNLARQKEMTTGRAEDPDHISLVVVPKETVWDFQISNFSIPGNKKIKRSLVPPFGPCTARIYVEWKGRENDLAIKISGHQIESPLCDKPGARPFHRTFEVQAEQFETGTQLPVTLINNQEYPVDGVMDIMYLPQRPKKVLQAALWSFLDQRRLLTTRHHVVGPQYIPVSIRADLYLRKDALGAVVRRKATEIMRNFFHPLAGGPDSRGWAFGRDVYLSEVYDLLDKVQGVDHVENVQLHHPDEDRMLRSTADHDHTIIGIRLSGHELVLPDTKMSCFTTRLL